jgi:hypothetical protein
VAFVRGRCDIEALKEKEMKVEAATGPSARRGKVRFILDRPARASDFPEGSWSRKIFERIMSPNVQRRIAADAALPKRFHGGDGILFDPKWQE